MHIIQTSEITKTKINVTKECKFYIRDNTRVYSDLPISKKLVKVDHMNNFYLKENIQIYFMHSFEYVHVYPTAYVLYLNYTSHNIIVYAFFGINYVNNKTCMLCNYT